MELNSYLLQTYFIEYEKLKDEQIHRIAFRDNMIFVTLGAVGGVASFTLTNPQHIYALLVIPWVCVVLGWTYIANDRAISAIGHYIRHSLSDKIQGVLQHGNSQETAFNWETVHREDKHRRQRKSIQFGLDLLTFCVSGLISLVWLYMASPLLPLSVVILMLAEGAFLLGLAYLFLIHSDRGSGW